MLLPAQRDHLVRSRAGVVVMGLRAHPDETPENKRLLTDIIEKWSRPVYGKGVSHSSYTIGLGCFRCVFAFSRDFAKHQRTDHPCLLN
jgi:TFIIS helical bundle-like domain